MHLTLFCALLIAALCQRSAASARFRRDDLDLFAQLPAPGDTDNIEWLGSLPDPSFVTRRPSSPLDPPPPIIPTKRPDAPGESDVCSNKYDFNERYNRYCTVPMRKYALFTRRFIRQSCSAYRRTCLTAVINTPNPDDINYIGRLPHMPAKYDSNLCTFDCIEKHCTNLCKCRYYEEWEQACYSPKPEHKGNCEIYNRICRTVQPGKWPWPN